MKSKFEWRVNGFDRMGQAGVHSIGMGVLIGLEKEWRTDICMMAYHCAISRSITGKPNIVSTFPECAPPKTEASSPIPL